MASRKNFWMYDCDQVKYRTPMQWSCFLVLSGVFALFGIVLVYDAIEQYRLKHDLDTGLVAIAVMLLACVVIELPASMLFFCRRWRGEITGYFDYEVLENPETQGHGDEYGPDHR